MLRSILTVLLLAGVGVFLGGCARMSPLSIKASNSLDSGGPSLSKTINLKGRAFALRHVGMAAKSGPPGAKYHCLPNRMYVAMLRYDLKQAFKNAGLTQGKKPPVPVDVRIFYQWYRPQLAVDLKFGHHTTAIGIQANIHEHKAWLAHQRDIPALAVKIAGVLSSVQHGKVFGTKISWLFGPYASDWNGYGVIKPMPPAQMEHITGKSLAQIKRICKQRIAAN